MQAAVAVHRVGHVHQQRVRDGVARVAHQGVDDLLGVMSGRARVPQPQRGQPVGVDVLGGALEFGERGDGLAGFAGERMVDLQQQGLVRLDDQGAVIHSSIVPVRYDSSLLVPVWAAWTGLLAPGSAARGGC